MSINNVNKIISKEIVGKSVFDQKKIDQLMIDLDGTHNKANLGANAILGVSLATAKAASNEKKIPLYSYISNNSEYKLVSGDLLTSSKNVIEKLRSAISINGNDFVTCKNTSLADILSQINLVYGVNHNIKSKLLNDSYTISFPKNDINQCIAILKQISGYNFTFIDNSIVLK